MVRPSQDRHPCYIRAKVSLVPSFEFEKDKCLITQKTLQHQEALFAEAFSALDIQLASELYHQDVIYLSPTVRLYDWPDRIEGRNKTLEFIQLTIRECRDLQYQAVESSIVPGNTAAFVRIHYDFNYGKGSTERLRSNYISLYRYRDNLISQQEIYYDPSGKLKVLSN